MEHDAFRYDFTGKELIYSLLKKKKCPKCGGEMEKHKNFETVNGSIFRSNSSPIWLEDARTKHYIYTFVCQDCGSEYSLHELAEGKGNI